MSEKPQILYLVPGPLPPAKISTYDKFHYLSEWLCGDVFVPISPTCPMSELPEQRGAFTYHYYNYNTPKRLFMPSVIGRMCTIPYFIVLGLILFLRGRRYSVVVSCGTGRTAVVAYALKLLTGAKFLIEIRSNPDKSFLYNERTPTTKDRVVNWLSQKAFVFFVTRADRLKLLFPNQIELHQGRSLPPQTSFHDFVALHQVPQNVQHKDRVLFVGYPWYLKGVDTLILAFNTLSARFPQTELHILGYCEDLTPFERLRNNNQQIVFRTPLPYDEVLREIAAARILVLPSRTEGMGRVLLEAMAAGVPVIGSRVDGIPYYVRDGETGLLFTSEDVADLAKAMLTLLENAAMAATLASRAQEYATANFSEESFAKLYGAMIRETISARH